MTSTVTKRPRCIKCKPTKHTMAHVYLNNPYSAIKKVSVLLQLICLLTQTVQYFISQSLTFLYALHSPPLESQPWLSATVQ